jgi:hypothetical protein
VSFFGWSLDRVAPPWGGRPSIHAHVAEHGAHPDADVALPDEERFSSGSGLRWAPGALDGLLLRQGEGEATPEQVASGVLEALRDLTVASRTRRAAALYEALTSHATLDYIDVLMQALADDEGFHHGRLHTVARWLATESADREPVKFGMALLGLFREEADRELLLTLGRHEEFTLYAAVALANAEEQPGRLVWQLATQVRGWGRIQCVERLAGTEHEQIRAWLLRDGWDNDIMAEYTALTCATAGGLVGALRLPDPDDALLTGAGEILAALIRGDGGPAAGIRDYGDGAEAADLWLAHLHARPTRLEWVPPVLAVRRFLEGDTADAGVAAPDWAERRERLRAATAGWLARQDVPELVRDGLSGDDDRAFNLAAESAHAVGIDPWDAHFLRLLQGRPHQWWHVMQTGDPTRIDRVIHVAMERLPLDTIATGPADELGVGPEWQDHSALDFIVQDLRRFPGKGWPLVRAALHSPVTRNRNIAVATLAAWGRAAWPPDAEPLLRRALVREPTGLTREAMARVLDGGKGQG